MVAQLISRHGPDFVLLFSFLLIFSMYFCVIFLQAETPPVAQQNTFYESFKRPAPGATFQCLDRRQKK
jgi:hypothetical protein